MKDKAVVIRRHADSRIYIDQMKYIQHPWRTDAEKIHIYWTNGWQGDWQPGTAGHRIVVPSSVNYCAPVPTPNAQADFSFAERETDPHADDSNKCAYRNSYVLLELMMPLRPFNVSTKLSEYFFLLPCPSYRCNRRHSPSLSAIVLLYRRWQRRDDNNGDDQSKSRTRIFRTVNENRFPDTRQVKCLFKTGRRLVKVLR